MTVRIITGVDSLGREYVSRKKVRICVQCGGPHSRRGVATKFCSRKCFYESLRGIPFAQRQSPAKTQVDMNCKNCSSKFQIKLSAINPSGNFCGRQCSNTFNLDIFSTRFASRPSSLEVILYDGLAAAGVEFESQRRIGPFVVDAYIPSSRTAIEVDGAYWHSLPENIERDARKNVAMQGYGIPLVRITESAARADIGLALREAGICQ